MLRLRDQFAPETIMDRVRARWAEIILRGAEVLPKFSGGIIAELQSIREHQRERSEHDFKGSRLPEGTHLELRRFTLFQLHTIEDFDAIEKKLLSLFPETGAYHLQDVRRGLDNLRGASWAIVGQIARTKQSFSIGETAVMEDVPTGIERISLTVQQVLPSFFVLAFGVDLTNDMSTQLLRLNQAKYLGRVMFNHWFHWSSGRSYGQPEVARERAITGFIEAIRAKAEAFVVRHFPHPTESSISGFTAIEEFHLIYHGLSPSTGVADSTAGWRGQFGLNAYDCFIEGRITFLAAGRWTGFTYPARLLVTEDVNAEEEVQHTQLQVEEIIHSLGPFLPLLHMLSSFENTTARLRRQVFQRIMSRRKFSSFRKEILFNAVLQGQQMSLERIALEYKQHQKLLGKWCADLKSLIHVHAKNQLNLLDALEKALIDKVELVSKHLQLASKTFDRHVAARNVAITHWFSCAVLFLSVIAALATMLNLIPNWPVIWRYLKDFVHYFH